MPKALKSSFNPNAARTPSPMPITEETAPKMAASASTERNTWRRLAPTIRSKASSARPLSNGYREGIENREHAHE